MATREDAKKARNKVLAGIAGAAVVIVSAVYGANKLLKKDAQKDDIESTLSKKDRQQLNEEFYDALMLTDVERVKALIEKGVDVNDIFHGRDALSIILRSDSYPLRRTTEEERQRWKKAAKSSNSGTYYMRKLKEFGSYQPIYDDIDYKNPNSSSFMLKHQKNEKIFEIAHILLDNGFRVDEHKKWVTLGSLAKRINYNYTKNELDPKFPYARTGTDRRPPERCYSDEQIIENQKIAKEDKETFGKFVRRVRKLLENQQSSENIQAQQKGNTYQITQRDFDGR
ncbi:MAG TPA: hypothetical protein DIC64_00860 [Alphaproteobacteria bacterium]|nr:hypothetical protein [Alphaproteobacteria bacterium]